MRLFTSLLLLLASLGTLPGVFGLAVFDPTLRCEPHPDMKGGGGVEVCIDSFEYYWIPDSDVFQDDPNQGWSWYYDYVNEYQIPIGEQVLVKLKLDQETCEISLAGGSQVCQSCSFCNFHGGSPDERQNAKFKADCTNLPGGREIKNCESTFPFYFPVDWYDENYLNQGATNGPTETMGPSGEGSESLGPSGEGSESFGPSGEGSETMGPSEEGSSMTSAPTKERVSIDSGDERTIGKTDKHKSYYYRSQLEMTMQEAVDDINFLDADVVLVKLQDFFTKTLAPSVVSMELILDDYDMQGAGEVVLKFETYLSVDGESIQKEREAALFLATNADWQDFISNYLRNTTGDPFFKSTYKVVLRIFGSHPDS